MVWSRRIDLRRRVSILALFSCLGILPAGSAGQNAGQMQAARDVKSQIAAGQLQLAAETLETEAARFPDRAPDLFRAAGWLRERLGELGQALLDYRAMQAASAPDSKEPDFGRHMAHLSLLIDHEQKLVGLPLAKDLQLEVLFPGWTGRQQAGGKGISDDSDHSLPIPGGASLLAHVLGIDEVSLKGPEALERVFSFILKSFPDTQDDRQNPVRHDVLLYLKHYADLMRYMQKQHLLPSDSGVAAAHEADFPLFGERADVARTRKLLSFFGIDYDLKRAKGGEPTVTLRPKDGQKRGERQLLLRMMGNSILDRNLRSIRVVLDDGNLPLLFDPETWERILSVKAASQPLLYYMVENANAMRLYLALSRCSAAARELLVQSVPGHELLKVAGVLRTFGPALDVRDQHLILPGSAESWEHLVGAPDSSPAHFLPAFVGMDMGKALVLYSSLSAAPEPVSAYFTSAPERLMQLYQCVSSSGGRASTHHVSPPTQDSARILRLMRAGESGLTLDLKPRLAGALVAEKSDQSPEPDSAPVRLDQKGLEHLFDMADAAPPIGTFSQLDVLEFLRYVQQTRPGLLTDETISAMMQSPEQTPVFMDLIWDIGPDPSLVPRYLQYCRELAAAGRTGWNVNRTRSSQSLFFLISALCREGALTQEQGNELLAGSLSVLSAHDEAAFAASLADFLSAELLPRIGNPREDDVVLRALAGQAPGRAFGFEGSQLELEVPAYRLQRMKETIQQQHYTPLPPLLEIYGILKAIGSGDKNDQGALTASLSEKLSRLEPAKLTPASSKLMRDSVAHAEIDKLRAKPGHSAQEAAEVAAQLHTELGVTLLTYCYAYSGSPDIDELAFDADFIRKHSFYGMHTTSYTPWTATVVGQNTELGTFLGGSLSGLGFRLCYLETAQMGRTFGAQEEASFLPALLFSMRRMRSPLRSDRSQEYVALTVRLGREVLALACLDEDLQRWVRGTLARMTSPRRREQAELLVDRRNPMAAARALSPSELFLLGEAYFRSLHAEPHRAVSDEADHPAADAGDGNAPMPETRAEHSKAACPLIDRLNEIIPDSGSADAARFREEVEQYGILLRRRLGLTQLSFRNSDSYEGLERSMRREVLYERVCDLKIRMAELGYSLGLPASLGELEAELALHDILPRSPVARISSWQSAIEQIELLGKENVRNWVNDLISRGSLTVLPAGTDRDPR